MQNNKQNVDEKNRHTEEEKIKAAYALNMCTVSVSQIVDYNDLYILEQEYDAVLNNLNLKEIPNDDALLNILTELLNTITFFRIQELKKEQIEKEYQQRIKDAIWSAVPSPSIFVTGNPIMTALSLATTIGTGYMNYRREKNQAEVRKDKDEMELTLTAMEQFNALRRELFTAAWRFAGEYDFEDRFRLTERQIKQYNEILLDMDEYRKYERLEAISDKFEAYPPFWYFYGHSANYISNVADDETTKQHYRQRAKEHFEHYEMLNKFNILREDQITASFALEYVDLLLLEKHKDINKIKSLIKCAAEKAGNNNDILQLCAVAFLRIGEMQDVKKILKILINENYNPIINGQILSGIYVGERNRPEYFVLTKRISSKYLYPMPEDDRLSIEDLNHEFEVKQRQILKRKYNIVLHDVINKYTEEMNKELSVFDLNVTYEDSYFANTPRAKKERLSEIKKIWNDNFKKNSYLKRIQNLNMPLVYVEILENMFGKLFEISCYIEPELQDGVIQTTTAAIMQNKASINLIQEKIEEGCFGVREYDRLQKMGLGIFVREAFSVLYRESCRRIEEAEQRDFPKLEGELLSICRNFSLKEPEIAIDENEYSDKDYEKEISLFDVGLFGSKAVAAKMDADFILKMKDFIKKKMGGIQYPKEKLNVFYRGDEGFQRYFRNSIFEKYPALEPHSVMVLSKRNIKEGDLIFTTEGIVNISGGRVGKKTPYEDVKYKNDALDLLGKKYRNGDIDIAALFEIIRGLESNFINNIDQKMEYYEGKLDGKILHQWFVRHPESMSDGITRVYAWPDKKLLESMGVHMEKELDKNYNILQFYFEQDSNTILGLRIVEFEEMDAKFAKMIKDAGGVLREGKAR